MVESIRFSGLASGLDTQSIVDSMMRASRLPLDRLQQQKQVLEWQRDDYREMNKLLKEFDQFIFDGIYRQSNMLKRSTTTSNDQYVTATGSAEAGNVTYKIENVKLATAARRVSTATISSTGANKLDPTKSMWSQQSKFTGTGGLKFTQSDPIGNTFTVNEEGANSTYQLSKKAISSAENEGVTPKLIVNGSESDYVIEFKDSFEGVTFEADKVYINSDTGEVRLGDTVKSSLNKDDTFEIKFKQNFLEFDIKTYDDNGNAKYTNFKLDASMSMNQMFNTINTSSAGINAFYDEGTDKVVISRKETGDRNKTGDLNEMDFVNVIRNADGTITEDSKSGFFYDILKLGEEYELNTDGSYKKDSEGNYIRLGTDVQFTINGLTTTRKSNTFTMNGVTFTLKKDMAAGESTSISTSTDTESIYKTIKDFVDKYNEMIGKINGELTEERFKSFTPLTAEQKSGMKDKEIEQWEEKAKSGLLRRDSLLTSGLSKMRTDLYAEVTSNAITRTDKDYNQLAEIGIKTTKDYLERGKLEIDETKLKAAIEKNPEAVYQLFMADGPTYDQKGLARRLRDSIDDTMVKIEEKAGNTYKTEHGYSMGKDLLRINSDIDSWEERLKQIEQRYWNQFNAMEKAMQQMNNQSNQLLAQLGMQQ